MFRIKINDNTRFGGVFRATAFSRDLSFFVRFTFPENDAVINARRLGKKIVPQRCSRYCGTKVLFDRITFFCGKQP